MKFKILKTIELKEHHKASGNTKHYVEGKMSEKPKKLQIVSYANNLGVPSILLFLKF